MFLLQRLRDLREDMDLYQKDIADYLHCSQVTYSRYELGTREIPLESLNALADFYGVSVDYLMGRTAHGFGVHFIECTEIPCYVLEEASRLDNLVEAGACGFQNGFQVCHDLLGLSHDVSCFYIAGRRIDGDLTGSVQHITDFDSL